MEVSCVDPSGTSRCEMIECPNYERWDAEHRNTNSGTKHPMYVAMSFLWMRAKYRAGKHQRSNPED